MAKPRPAQRPCPCTSGARYGACCQPYHRGAEPPDPEALVRSRFSAFARGDGAYLWRTLHPAHPSRARPRAAVVEELSRARRALRYRALEVHDEARRGRDAFVLFTARVFERGQDRSFSELSRFREAEGGWRYLEGVTRPGELAEDQRTVDAFDVPR